VPSGSCSSEHRAEELPTAGTPVPLDPRVEAAMNELASGALRALPLAWDGVVVEGQYYAHNPDELDLALELFPPEDRPRLARLAGASGRPLPPATLPWATVLTGEALARHYARPVYRVLFVSTPLLSGDGRTGLVVAQMQEAGPGGAMAVDHWVLMERTPSGTWQRRPIPPDLRRALFLTDETGGGPSPASG
jgi:hypothetical protein